MCAKLCAPPGTGINWSDMYYFAIISRTYMYLRVSFCSWLVIRETEICNVAALRERLYTVMLDCTL